MIVQLFGILDFITGVMLILLHFGGVSWRIAFGFAMYLFIKAYMFKGDFASIMDFITGVYFVLVIFGIHTYLVYLFVLYLIQKAFFSLWRF